MQINPGLCFSVNVFNRDARTFSAFILFLFISMFFINEKKSVFSPIGASKAPLCTGILL